MRETKDIRHHYQIIGKYIELHMARVVSPEISGNFRRNFSGNFRKNSVTFPEFFRGKIPDIFGCKFNKKKPKKCQVFELLFYRTESCNLGL